MEEEKKIEPITYDPHVGEQGWGSLSRDSVFTRMVLENRWNRQRFKELKQQQFSDKSRSYFLTEEKLAEYENVSLRDKLTGLFNARSFRNKLRYEVRRAKRYKRPVSLLILRIDRIDELRRQFGTLVLDEVIKSAADIVRQAIRDVDLPSRSGIDQLAIIFPETYSSRAIVVGERIRDLLKTTKISDDIRGLRCTASIGVVSFPTHARDDVELLRLALEFLEQAHKSGGDAVYSG